MTECFPSRTLLTFSTTRDLGEEIEFKEGGIIQTRAQSVLAEAEKLLRNIEKEGLFATIEQANLAA